MLNIRQHYASFENPVNSKPEVLPTIAIIVSPFIRPCLQRRKKRVRHGTWIFEKDLYWLWIFPEIRK